MLKQWLATSVSCDGEIEKHLIDESKSVLRKIGCASFEKDEVTNTARWSFFLYFYIACSAAEEFIYVGSCCSFQIRWRIWARRIIQALWEYLWIWVRSLRSGWQVRMSWTRFLARRDTVSVAGRCGETSGVGSSKQRLLQFAMVENSSRNLDCEIVCLWYLRLHLLTLKIISSFVLVLCCNYSDVMATVCYLIYLSFANTGRTNAGQEGKIMSESVVVINVVLNYRSFRV